MRAISRRHTGRLVLIATVSASSMTYIDSTALNVALNALQQDLHATGLDLIWILNAYLLPLAALILLGGSLGDHYGRNRVFRIGIVLFMLASLVCGLSPSVGILIAARFVQGIGGALIVPASLAIITASFGPDQRGQAIGIWSAIGTLVTIIGPVVGGFLVGAGLWRGVFFINIPLAVLSIITLSGVQETRNEFSGHRLDYPGTLFITLGLAGITYGAIGLGQDLESSVVHPGVSLLFGAIMVLLFLWTEAHSSHPMVPLSLFRQPTFRGTNLMTFFLYGAVSATFSFFLLNLTQIQGYDADIAGLTFLPFALLLAVMSLLMARLVRRVGPRLLLTAGAAVVAVGLLLLAAPDLTNGPADYWITYFPGIMMLGLGMGIADTPLSTAVMSSVSSQKAGIASGVNNAITYMAQNLAVAFLGVLLVIIFTGSLNTRIGQSDLSPDMQRQIEQNAGKLGNTDIPTGLSTQAQATVHQTIRRSFVDGFRLIASISAGFCLLSALASALWVEDRLVVVREPATSSEG